MPVINTATGPIKPTELGFTLHHEHVLNHRYGLGVRQCLPFLFDMEATRNESIRLLKRAKSRGIRSFIDVTTMDLQRDVRFMADVSKATRRGMLSSPS